MVAPRSAVAPVCHRVSPWYVPAMSQPDAHSPADILQELRDLLAAIAREAGRRGFDEVVDLAGRADEKVELLLGRERDNGAGATKPPQFSG